MSYDNPANLIAVRTSNPYKPISWWSGPTWLAANANEWPVSANKPTTDIQRKEW